MAKTHYIWDFENDTCLMEKDESGATTAVYTNEPTQYGKPISQRRGNSITYYHFDAEQSTRQLTDENQIVTDEYTYSAFGEAVATSGTTANPFRYKGGSGYYFDSEIGTNYVRERQYLPAAARWLTCDPLRFGDRESILEYAVPLLDNVVGMRMALQQTFRHPYIYCQNNPILYVDPSGLAESDGNARPKCCCNVESMTPQPKQATCGLIRYKEDNQTKIAYVAEFAVTAKFKQSCSCCSYRQEIKGFVRHRIIPGGTWQIDRQVKDFEEDCETKNGKKVCYGHREDDERSNDVYGDDRKTGCSYAMSDKPGAYDIQKAIQDAIRQGKQLEIEIDLVFRFKIIDTCCKDEPFPPIEYPVKCKEAFPVKKTK